MTPTIQPTRYEVWGYGWKETGFRSMRWAILYAQRQHEHGYACDVWQVSGYLNSHGQAREYHVEVRWEYAEGAA